MIERREKITLNWRPRGTPARRVDDFAEVPCPVEASVPAPVQEARPIQPEAITVLRSLRNGDNMTARQPLERRAHPRIREMLNEWAEWHRDRSGLSYPSQAAFSVERVQASRHDGQGHLAMPDDIVKLDREINNLAPGFRRIVSLEYLDGRPQKAKAADLKISREAFSARLRFIHEHLDHTMFCL